MVTLSGGSAEQIISKAFSAPNGRLIYALMSCECSRLQLRGLFTRFMRLKSFSHPQTFNYN